MSHYLIQLKGFIMAFDRVAYDKQFKLDITALTKAEKVTKEVLRNLSRSVLEAVQVTEDVSYINNLLAALTPINRKVAILYFMEFSGFRTDGVTFGKKDKAKYEEIKAAAITFLEDPMNNIWTWAEREVDIAQKGFDIGMVTKTMERMTKKATDAGLTQADVLRAVFKAGFDVEALLTVMTEMGVVKEEAKA